MATNSENAATFSFHIQPLERFTGNAQPVKRPKEFACFSYDNDHKFRIGDSSLQWYYTPQIGADLSSGFESFDKHDDSIDEHLDSLLKTIISHEKAEGTKIDAQLVTWRGMITKIMATPFDDRDGFEMNATLFQDCIFVEESHEYKQAARREQESQQHNRRGGGGHRHNPQPPRPSQDVMTYWGYKFETLSTIPAPWAETSRDYIESRPELPVSNKAQYCSLVRTGLGKTIMCIGGEVDAVWDEKPEEKGAPINWVELKTSLSIPPNNQRTMANFERKLMKFWIQSFLLGVPRIIVGFRSEQGILESLEDIRTESIPITAAQRGVKSWNAAVCINFGAIFLEWLKTQITTEGVWRIRRQPNSPLVEVFQVEKKGHGRILTEEFLAWREKEICPDELLPNPNEESKGTEPKAS